MGGSRAPRPALVWPQLPGGLRQPSLLCLPGPGGPPCVPAPTLTRLHVNRRWGLPFPVVTPAPSEAREADTRARPLPHLWTGDGRPVKPGDAASHLRADHAWGAWGAGLALETLGGESRHTEMAEVARAAPSAPAPARRTPRTSLGGARPSRPLLLSFKGMQQARRCHEVLCAAFVLRNTF